MLRECKNKVTFLSIKNNMISFLLMQFIMFACLQQILKIALALVNKNLVGFKGIFGVQNVSKLLLRFFNRL